MKYPITLLFRYDKYTRIDYFLDQNKDKMNFSVTITNDANDLNKLFDSNNNLLITFGQSDKEYAPAIDTILPQRMRKRWIHFNDIPDINLLNQVLNTCYMNIITCDAILTRPTFSLFTTCYKSYEKIFIKNYMYVLIIILN